MDIAILIASIGVALTIVMAVAWAIARKPGRSGWTDVIWSFAVGAGGVVAALAPVTGPPSGRQWLVAALAALWSLRLGLHIAGRTIGGGDDPRYKQMRDDWGDAFDLRLFWFLEIQAAAALLLVTTILLAARNTAPTWAWSDIVGALMLAGAVIGEGVADRQLARFRKTAKGKDAVCDVGLWGWSRHPNYFFEWLGWLAYALIAIGPAGQFAWGWLSLAGPAFMYWLLVYVSGIPPLEAHMLRSRSAAFEAYQKRVSAFWPLPPASSEGSAR